MNMQKQQVIMIALAFFFSLSTPAFASKERDFSDQPSSPDPVVQTTSGSKESKGESVKKEGLADHQADFKKENSKEDPVVQTTSGSKEYKGESVKKEGLADHQADFKKEN